MKKYISIFICIIMLFSYKEFAFSEGMSTYESLLWVGDEFIPRLTAAGATLEQIEVLLDGMDAVVESYQEGIYASDLDEYFIMLLLQNLQLPENLPVLVAFDRDYQEEIIYMATYRKVPDNMTTLKYTVFSNKIIVDVDDYEEVFIPSTDHEEIPEEPPKEEIKEEIILPFDDIKDVEWCIESVVYLFENGIISGTGERIFEPDKYISREEFLKMIVSALLKVEEFHQKDYGKYATGCWFHPYLATAEYYSLTHGIYDYDVSVFETDVSIKRQDMVTIAYRAIKRAGINIPDTRHSTDFMDIADISYYATEAIKELQEANIIDGMGNNMFMPNAPTTRAEAAKIIYNIIKLK